VGALRGLRVIDLTNLLAGPQVAAILADFGADVVKVEPPAGDPLSSIGIQRAGRSLPYVLVNRGKRVVRLDPSDDDDRVALQALLDAADVVVANQPMAVLRSWGADPDAVSARNPRAVVVTVSCFGTDGPWADRPGAGSLAEAFAGLTDLTGDAGGPPMLPSVALGDSLVGMAGALGALAACWSRDAGGGTGQHVDVTMYEPIIALLGPAVAAWDRAGPPPSRTGSRVPGGVPRNVYAAGDGRFLVLSATTDAQVARVLVLLGLDTSDGHARFARSEDRLARADELDGLVAAWVGARSRDAAIAELDAARLPVVAVHDLAELIAHPQARARGSLVTVADPVAGEVLLPGPVAHLRGTPAAVGQAPVEPVAVAAVLAGWLSD
jgi:crotonobetainyl-CoA:carnitine CoA-transferase CaiB-like acyl-CoA transferase